jgi:hypothetical protein
MGMPALGLAALAHQVQAGWRANQQIKNAPAFPDSEML